MNHYSIQHLFDRGGRHYWISECLKKDGYEPMVFGCNEKHNQDGRYFENNKLFTEYTTESQVRYFSIKSIPYNNNGLKRILNMIKFAQNLIKTAKVAAKKYGKPDIIYASSVHPLTVLAGEKISEIFKKERGSF